MTKDEKVDGPKVAAQILNSMKSTNKEKIVKAIAATDPSLAQKIGQNLFTFEDIADFSTNGVQLLIKEIDHRDLVTSLKTASERLKGVFFANMSERKLQIVQEDFAALPPTQLGEIEECQRRIVRKADELRTQGLVRTQGKGDIWA